MVKTINPNKHYFSSIFWITIFYKYIYLLGKAVQQKDLSNLDIAAQALIFFFAGFETVSALMCFMAYELAINPDIQQRLREEIEETLENCNGELTYEALLKMKYLDMVVSGIILLLSS